VSFEINLREVIYALSDALDLVGVDDMYHGKRVAVMVGHCCGALGWERAVTDDLLAGAMVHDIGVSSTRVHEHLVGELDWKESEVHCRVGHALLAQCPPLAHLAELVLHHHTHWERLGSVQVADGVASMANLIFLVDRVDALVAQHGGPTPLISRGPVRRVIESHRGEMFAPELVDVFMEVSRPDSFWLSLEPRFLARYLGAWVKQGQRRPIEFARLECIAWMFSHCVDAKSRFTAEHSRGVARLSVALGEWMGLGELDRQKLELAGLLHDLGKLRVPDEILEKPGPLTSDELAIMERHSFDSRVVLDGIQGLEDVAEWASQHHETLDGRGYPYRRRGADLGIQARIVAVADVFQALAQDRPYRKSMNLPEILEVLEETVKDGHLDRHLVDLVEANLARCWELARGTGSTAEGGPSRQD